MENWKEVNKENVLLTKEGVYNFKIHEKLDNIIHKVAMSKIRTNPNVDIDDLCQDAWIRVLDVIDKNLKKGKELEIKYLVAVVQSIILGKCEQYSKYDSHIDSYRSMVLNECDCSPKDFASYNTRKSKLENEINDMLGTSHPDEKIILRIAMEDLIDSIENEDVKNFIVIKYVKECNGESEYINNIYDEFYKTLDYEKQCILKNMTKFTNNAVFKCLGMRSTDNKSTYIRNEMKRILEELL